MTRVHRGISGSATASAIQPASESAGGRSFTTPSLSPARGNAITSLWRYSTGAAFSGAGSLAAPEPLPSAAEGLGGGALTGASIIVMLRPS